jgi:hypothetical protein
MKTISKTVKRSKDLFIEFSEEELSILNIKEGDKFSWRETGEGIILEKFSSLDIDLKDLSRDSLEFLVSASVEEDKSINEIINEILEKFVDQNA